MRRTQAGSLSVADARTLETIATEAEFGGASAVLAMFADPLAALDLPRVASDRVTVVTGRRLPRALAPAEAQDGSRVAVTVDGSLAAVYRVAADSLSPEVVLLRGDAA